MSELSSALGLVFSYYLEVSDLLPNVALVCHKWKEALYAAPIWSQLLFTGESGGDIILKNISGVPYLQKNLKFLFIEPQLGSSQQIANIPKYFPEIRTLALLLYDLEGDVLIQLIENLAHLEAIKLRHVGKRIRLEHIEQCMKFLLSKNIHNICLEFYHFPLKQQSINCFDDDEENSEDDEENVEDDEEISGDINQFLEHFGRYVSFDSVAGLYYYDWKCDPFITPFRSTLRQINISPSKYPLPQYASSMRLCLPNKDPSPLRLDFVFQHDPSLARYYYRQIDPAIETLPKEDVEIRLRQCVESLQSASEGEKHFLAFSFPNMALAHQLVSDHHELWKQLTQLLVSKFTILVALPYYPSIMISSEERSTFILKWFPGCYLRTRPPSQPEYWDFSTLPIKELILYMRRGCKLDWSYRGLSNVAIRNPNHCFLANRMIYHLLDRFWKCIPEQIRNHNQPSPDDVDATNITIPDHAVQNAIQKLLPRGILHKYNQSIITSLSCDPMWTLEDCNYEVAQKGGFHQRSVRLALCRYGNVSSHGTFLITCAIRHIMLHVGQKVFYRVSFNSDKILAAIRDDPICDSLFWDMPLNGTFWYAFSPLDGERTGSFHRQIRSVPSPYTEEQKRLLEEENHYRALLVSDRSNPELADPYFNLVNVFNNTDQFYYQSLDEQEQRIPRLLKSQQQQQQQQFRNHASEGSVDSPKQQQISSICSQQEFDDRWESFTHGIFKEMDWSNVFVAGGAILGALNANGTDKYKSSDIDLFLYGFADEAAAEAKLTSIIQTVYSNSPEYLNKDGIAVKQCTIFRSKNSITIMRGYPYRHIQVILRLYQSPAEILLGFDIDCCSVGFDGTNVYCTPRCVRALNKCYNLINPTRRSTTYEYRLFKYSKRGFAVLVPTLDGSKIDTSIYEKRPIQVNGLAKLLLYDYDRRAEMAIDTSKIIRSKKKDACNRLHPCDEFDKESMINLEESSDYAAALPFGPNWDGHNTKDLVNLHNWKNWHNRKKDFLKVFSPLQDNWLNLCMEGLTWMTINPGQQTYETMPHSSTTTTMMTGSFQPLSGDTWEEDAYHKD